MFSRVPADTRFDVYDRKICPCALPRRRQLTNRSHGMWNVENGAHLAANIGTLCLWQVGLAGSSLIHRVVAQPPVDHLVDLKEGFAEARRLSHGIERSVRLASLRPAHFHVQGRPVHRQAAARFAWAERRDEL